MVGADFAVNTESSLACSLLVLAMPPNLLNTDVFKSLATTFLETEIPERNRCMKDHYTFNHNFKEYLSHRLHYIMFLAEQWINFTYHVRKHVFLP